jgi:hypothetical protein
MSAAKMATGLRDWLSGMVSPWFDESSVPSSVEKKDYHARHGQSGGKRGWRRDKNAD